MIGSIAVLLILSAALLWLVMFTLTYLGARRRGGRSRLGGGVLSQARYEEPWSAGHDEARRLQPTTGDVWALARLVRKRGEEFSVVDIQALTNEAPHVIAKRLRVLEAKGFIVRVASDHYVLTDLGRRYLSMYRERLQYRRREQEALENQ